MCIIMCFFVLRFILNYGIMRYNIQFLSLIIEKLVFILGGIEFVQSFSNPFLDVFFEGVTIVAEQFIMMFVVGYFYWCSERTYNAKFMLTVMSGFSVNALFKNIFRVQRPFVKYKDEIRTLRMQTATGYSYPSGHTQNATTVFGLIGFKLKRFFPLIGFALIFLIGFSRVYLGVHTVYDVLGGLAFGAVWCFVSFKIYDILEKKKEPLWFLLYAIPSFFAIIFVNLNFPGDTFNMTGSSIGAIVGIVVENKFIKFNPINKPKKQVIKMILGLGVALILQNGLKVLFLLFIKETTIIWCVFDFIRYFICTFWITAAIPFISKKYLEKDLTVNENE